MRTLFRHFISLLLLSVVSITSIQAQTFEYKSHSNAAIANYSMPYRLFIPSDYDPNKSYPLVLFLHGAGERGSDNNLQVTANNGATRWAETENQNKYPCFVLAPQCPGGRQWVNTSWLLGSYSIDNIPVSTEIRMVKDMIDGLKTEYSIDASRLFITGLSMGAYGTWDFILRYPTMFKAAICMAGAGDPTKASLLGTMPIWAFHSNDDGAVPVTGSRDMVNAINALGFNDRSQFYSEYYNQGHFAINTALVEPNLVNWMFTVEPVTITPGLVDVTKFAGTSSAQGGSASNAFDDAIYTTWLDFANNNPTTRSSWVQYHFSGGAYPVTRYTITSAEDFPQRNPRDWNLLGSNDGENWTILDTRTNQVFNNSFQRNIYSFANTTAYSYYRLKINAVSNPAQANSVQLSEIRLWMECDNIVPVTGVELSSNTTFIEINSTKQLIATVLPEQATNKTMVWQSSDQRIVKVSANGLLTGIGAGTATVTATTDDGAKVATCNVTVFNLNEITKLTGTQSDNITPSCCGNDGGNAFDGDISTFVDADAASGGYTQLDFGSQKNVTIIKFYPRPDYANRMVGGVFQGSNDGVDFTTIYTINTSPAYDWNSVTVNVRYRFIRYLGPTDGYCNVAEIECLDAVSVAVKGVSVSPATAAVAVDKSRQLTATIMPENATNKTVIWTSSDTSVATVSSTGLVTAISPGTAEITATTQDQGKIATCNVLSFICNTLKLTGRQFDNITPYGNGNTDGDKAFDGSISTFTDASSASGGYTGLDFESEKTISLIRFMARSGFTFRLTGGKFQGSNDNVNWTDVYTISGTPLSSWNSVNVNASYRYMRYLGPTDGYCNIAEIEFWGCSPDLSNVQNPIFADSKSNTMLISPNPAKPGETIHLEAYDNANVEIYGMDGKLLYSTKLDRGSFVLPVVIGKGLYIVSVNKKQQVKMGKLLVK